MQDAIIVAVPPVAVPLAPPALLTVTDAASEELQVSGIPVMVVPRLSITVGVMVFELLVEVVTSRVIDCTGQVVKLSGMLVTLPMVANRGERPGILAVTCICPWSKALSEVFSVATLGFRSCHSNTPTVEVTSTPRL